MELKNEMIQAGGIRLNVITAGPKGGPPVVLLHGFPERALSWRDYIELLANHGFFVIAPEQRGYGHSERPGKVSDYRMECLSLDIVHVMNHYQIKKANLIGHDWGCAVGWFLITIYPERFNKALLLSSPHWEVFRKHLLLNPSQALKSWYMFAIQFPKLPELFISAHNFKFFGEAIKKSAFNAPYPESELVALKKEWKEKSSMTFMLNWYRAMKDLKEKSPKEKISVPVTLVWGARDPFLQKKMAEDSLALCEKGQFILLENTGHWPHHENKIELSTLMLSLFGV